MEKKENRIVFSETEYDQYRYVVWYLYNWYQREVEWKQVVEKMETESLQKQVPWFTIFCKDCLQVLENIPGEVFEVMCKAYHLEWVFCLHGDKTSLVHESVKKAFSNLIESLMDQNIIDRVNPAAVQIEVK